MANPPLSEKLYGLFYDVFKRMGVPTGPDQLEHLRGYTDKITSAITDEIKENMKRLARITIDEMEKLEKRLSNGQENVKKEIGSGEGSGDSTV